MVVPRLRLENPVVPRSALDSDRAGRRRSPPLAAKVVENLALDYMYRFLAVWRALPGFEKNHLRVEGKSHVPPIIYTTHPNLYTFP